ncbi:hypothetical protein EJD97_009219, partial [Solanum chilense]
NLTNLYSLDLSSNNITLDAGTHINIPSLAILSLSSCEPRDFPHLLKNVKTLKLLDISNNKIRGQIPNWFSSPLPSSICYTNKLKFLDLSHNNFSNSIPSCMGCMANLTVLDLRRNNFTGSIPPLCAQSTSLRTIFLNGNQFEGPVPMSLLNCDGLEILDVGKNTIDDTFPAWLGTLQELHVLILKSNKFRGPISTCQAKFCFPKLRIFDLSRNEFSGSLPAKVFGHFKAMIKLDGEYKGGTKYMKPLIQNEFSDIMIDKSSRYMKEIVSDEVYKDSLRLVIKGQAIEVERINTIMTTIDLSSNHFEGVIPKTLKELNSRQLNLSHNNLTGHIPMGSSYISICTSRGSTENVGKTRTNTKIYMVKVMEIKWENNDTKNF